MARMRTSTSRGSGTRFSASSRPLPAQLGRGRASTAERVSVGSAVAARMRVTTAAFAVLALVALVAGAPQTVTVPLATILLTALVVAGVLRGVAALVDRQMRPESA
jgi:hypothetical protein